METPWVAKEMMEKMEPERIDQEINYAKLRLQSENLTNRERSEEYFRLSTGNWLKTFQQKTKRQQVAYLKLALQQALTALKLNSENPYYHFRAAEIYNQLEEYEKAKTYYERALKRSEDPLIVRRYYNLQEKMGLNEE